MMDWSDSVDYVIFVHVTNSILGALLSLPNNVANKLSAQYPNTLKVPDCTRIPSDWVTWYYWTMLFAWLFSLISSNPFEG